MDIRRHADTLRAQLAAKQAPEYAGAVMLAAAVVFAAVAVLSLLYLSLRSTVLKPGEPDTSQIPLTKAVVTDVDVERALVPSEEITQRPLFWESRKPPVPEPSEDQVQEVSAEDLAAAEVKELEALKLLGTFGSGETAGIIVLHKNEKKRLISGSGDIDGWTLQSVDGLKARFTSGPRTHSIELERAFVAAPPPEPEPEAGTEETGESVQAAEADAQQQGAKDAPANTQNSKPQRQRRSRLRPGQNNLLD